MQLRTILLVVAVILLVIAALGALDVLGGVNVAGLTLLAAACYVGAQIT